MRVVQFFADGCGVPAQGQLDTFCGGAIALPRARGEGEFLADPQDPLGDFFAVSFRGVTVLGVPLVVLFGETRKFFSG